MASWSQLTLPDGVEHCLWFNLPLTAKLGLVGGAALLAGWLTYRVRTHSLPPGPVGLPFLGAVMSVSRDLYKDGVRMRATYGDVVSLRLGGELLVLVNGYRMIREAFVKRGPDFANRPLKNAKSSDEIFFAPYNEEWKANKKFAMTALRSFGFGKRSLEERIRGEVDHVLEALRASQGAPLDPMATIQQALAKVIASVMYSNTDEQLDVGELMKELKQWFGQVKPASTWRRLLPAAIRRLLAPNEFMNTCCGSGCQETFIHKQIKQHRATLDPRNPRDVIDVYLAARDGPELDVDRLVSTLLMFLPDAIFTVSHAIQWSILYLAYNPEVQNKIQDELDRVVGRSAPPGLEHRDHLPYTQAAILECFRLCNIFPLGAPHQPIYDTHLSGYKIPRDCTIFPNLYSVHMDPDTFPDPHKFDPGHFLDQNGDVINKECCIPFSIGRRMCPGEQLSRIEVFLFLTTILHNFTLTFPPGHQRPPVETHESAEAGGIIRHPQPFKIRAISR